MEYEIKSAPKYHFNLKEIWEFRELIYFFTLRDIKIKYKQTVLGIIWAILQPLLMMTIFTVFFSRQLNISSYAIPYPIFVFSGLILWNVFSTGLSLSGNSMVNNANIIKKIYFPRLIIPLAAVLGTLLDFTMTLILFIVLLYFYLPGASFLNFLLVLPISLFVTFLTTFGVGSFLAALNVKYRDFRYIIPFMIQVLLFITPVIYPISLMPAGWIRDLLSINPLAGAIDLVRYSITGTPIDWLLVFRSSAISLAFLFIGLTYFRKTEYYFADLS